MQFICFQQNVKSFFFLIFFLFFFPLWIWKKNGILVVVSKCLSSI